MGKHVQIRRDPAAAAATLLAASSVACAERAYADLDTSFLDAPTLAPDLADISPDVFLECVALADVPQAAWARLAERAIEPNAFYDPAWARAVSAHARGHRGAKALLVWDEPGREDADRIAAGACRPGARSKLPVPVLVAWQAYARLTTPLLDRDAAEKAAGGLVDAAAAAGARALLLPDLATDGPAADALPARAGVARDRAPHPAPERARMARRVGGRQGETATRAWVRKN